MRWPKPFLGLLPLILTQIVYQASASAITAAPQIARRQDGENSPACSDYYNAESSCSSLTSDWLSLDFAEQASCLCYSSATWAPSIFDAYVATCVAFLSTASPSFYSAIGGTGFPTAPCAELVPMTNSTSPPQSTAIDANAAACTSWDAIESVCSRETVSFGVLPFSAEASCLCYSGSEYAPSIYDGYWGSCLAFFKTANPDFYTSSLGGDSEIRTPCAAEGNVRISSTVTNAGSTGPTMSGSASSGAALTSLGPSATSSSIQQTSSRASSSIAITTTEPNSSKASRSMHSMWIDMFIGALMMLVTATLMS